MGKYMRKSKATSELAVMEVAQSTLGVRTRAKTLALQRLQKSAAAAAAQVTSGSSYLQLRSRRLEKKQPLFVAASHDSKRQKHTTPPQRQTDCMRNPNPNFNSKASSRLRVGGSMVSASGEDCQSVKDEVAAEKAVMSVEQEEEVQEKEEENTNNNDAGLEASFGENVLDMEGRERSTRESTPSSLIRDPDAIRTPGSTTRPRSSPEMNQRIQNSMRRHIPTAHEMDEFFSGAEEQQQKQFIEKYNFDPVNEKPLPGRFAWVKLDP